MGQSLISVVIPAFNEQEAVGEVIEDTMLVMNSLNIPYELIVVDDGSTDDTLRVAVAHKATVLSNRENLGKGYSIRRGIQHARGDIIVTLDSDGSHKPKEIPALIQEVLGGNDVVAGSRFMGSGKGWTTRVNVLGNRILNLVTMVLTGKRVTDSQTGFRAFKRTLVDKVSLESSGYEIESEITVKGLRNGFTFKEIPITCLERKYGVSKVKLATDGLRIIRAILRARFTEIKH